MFISKKLTFWEHNTFASIASTSENVIKIGNNAFSNCEFSGKLFTSPNLQRIGDFSFRNCFFKEVILYNNILSLSSTAFDGVNSVEKVIYHGTNEPSNCKEFNLQIHGIDSIHVDDDYKSENVCSFPIYADDDYKSKNGGSFPIHVAEKSGLSGGPIAGIVIGVAAFVVIVIGVILLLKKKNDRMTSHEQHSLDTKEEVI